MERDLRIRARRFRRLAAWTVAAVYLLILVGGFVRASGAGMGCPDWPKCFGEWVPPLAESELPADYQEIYRDQGYGDTRFNAKKTWTEYVNRLIGVGIGILIFITFLSSLSLAGVRPSVPRACFGAFVLVAIEGWLGGVLVDTNLADWAISLHLLGALLIVALLIHAFVRARHIVSGTAGVLATVRLGPFFALVLILSIGQMALGTQVRDQVDDLAVTLEGQRELWIDQLGWSYLLHRGASILVFLANVVLYRRISRATLASGDLIGAARVLLVLLGIQIAIGASLTYLGVPPILQPLHLLVAALVAGLQFGMWTMYRYQGAAAI